MLSEPSTLTSGRPALLARCASPTSPRSAAATRIRRRGRGGRAADARRHHPRPWPARGRRDHRHRDDAGAAGARRQPHRGRLVRVEPHRFADVRRHAFRVMGPDLAQVRDIAARVAEIMRANPHMREVNEDWSERVRSIHFVLDQDRLRRLGLSPRGRRRPVAVPADRHGGLAGPRGHPHRRHRRARGRRCQGEPGAGVGASGRRRGRPGQSSRRDRACGPSCPDHVRA